MTEERHTQIPIEDGDAGKAEKCEAQADEAAEAAEADKAEVSGASDKADMSPDDGESGGSAENSGDAGASGEKAADAEEAKAAAEQESERYMRLMAEFQNFKRRAAKEKTDIHAYANEKIIGELLPVLDNFERALATETADLESYAKGMELIFTQLRTALEHAGLSEIAALGEEFDPNVHNAVMTEQSEEQEDGRVSKVLQKGYKLNDKVIRPSMVAVIRN